MNMSRASMKIFLAAVFSLGLGSGALAEVIEVGPWRVPGSPGCKP